MSVNGPFKKDPRDLPHAGVSKANMEEVNEVCDWLYDAIDCSVF